MSINPNAPIYPEKDVTLIPNREQAYNPNDYPVEGQTTPPQTVDPDIDWQEIDISLLPGVPGQRGATGPAGPVGPVGNTGATGATGPAGPSSMSYVHTQNTVSSTWNITHNLGIYPNVTTTDVTGFVIEGETTYPTLNTVTVTFGIATTGFAYLS